MARVKRVTRGTSRPHLPKKQRRYKPGTVALWEIRRYQQTSELQVCKAPFSRLVRQIAVSFEQDTRITHSAVGALQEATEAYTTTFLEDRNLVIIYSKRVTVMSKDISLIGQIRGETENIIAKKRN